MRWSTVSDSSASIQTTFIHPLYQQANRNYELAMVNLETYYSDIKILPNVNTLQCILTVIGAKCKVSFDGPNSLASVGRHATENPVNIMNVNSTLVHCNITRKRCI